MQAQKDLRITLIKVACSIITVSWLLKAPILLSNEVLFPTKLRKTGKRNISLDPVAIYGLQRRTKTAVRNTLTKMSHPRRTEATGLIPRPHKTPSGC